MGYCFGRYAIPGETDLTSTHPQVLPFWSGKNTLSPMEVTAGSCKKVWWQCGDGHVWQAGIYARTKPNGTGCPVCAGAVKRRRQPEISPKKNRANLRAGGQKPRANVQI